MSTEVITLAQAQAKLDALMSASASNTLSVSYGGRTVTYKSAQDLREDISFWTRLVAEKKRQQAGASRHGHSVAAFRRGI